ncbi:MAG: hypothetical protein JKY00_09155 [Roseicyclus sp.]|nr:hypothetical protein [Roseicyclus sp.]
MPQAEDGADIRLTFDPSLPLHTITLAGPAPWPAPPTFEIWFEGVQSNFTHPNRHVVSPDRRRLNVSDRGFGNLLDGLQFNHTTTAISAEITLMVSLGRAASAVAAFRACGQTPSV